VPRGVSADAWILIPSPALIVPGKVALRTEKEEHVNTRHRPGKVCSD
jgi:hypothetical protein